MTTLEQLTEVIDKAIEKFAIKLNTPVKAYGNLTPSEKLFSDVAKLIDEMDKDGVNLKSSTKNLSIIKKIQAKIADILASPHYKNALDELKKTFAEVTNLQNQYYQDLTQKFNPNDFNRGLQDQAIKDVANGNFGVRGKIAKLDISKGIEKILDANVKGGVSYVKALTDMQNHLITDKGGALIANAKTIVTDSLNQYSRKYGEYISDGLGLEWYAYTGPIIATSRCFCKEMVKVRYFHKSEIKKVLDGGFFDCPINDKTGLPFGMIEDTDVSNFIENAGGYGCNHRANAVGVTIVPAERILDVYNTGVPLGKASLNKLKKANLI